MSTNIKLKGLKNELFRIDYGTRKRKYKKLPDDYEKFEVYAEPENNNTILALFSDYEKENLPNDVLRSVVGSTIDEAYNYLISALKKNKNMLVVWSKIEGTTSDFIICYHAIEKCWKKFSEIKPIIDSAKSDSAESKILSYKYLEYNNGNWNRVSFW